MSSLVDETLQLLNIESKEHLKYKVALENRSEITYSQLITSETMKALSCFLRDAFALWEKDTTATDCKDFRMTAIPKLQISSLLYNIHTCNFFSF